MRAGVQTVKADLATFPAFGIDTVMPLDVAACRFLVREGFHFVVRYLGKLTPEELRTVLCSGLALMPVTTSRKPGWTPSGELGERDGDNALLYLQALQIPEGVTVWLDLEGSAGPARATIDWVNAWSLVVLSAGYQPGLYVGANAGLDSEQLWQLPYVTRYWRSCSKVPEPANRGWCIQQLKPWNQKLGPLVVDIDVIEHDYRGDLPTWVIG